MKNLFVQSAGKHFLDRSYIFASISLGLLLILIYSNSFSVPWHFDDESNILYNRSLHLNELTWEKIKQTFYAGPAGDKRLYRPVACFSFAINYYVGGDNVFGYHVVNLAIHYTAGLFLFLFLFKTLRLPVLRERYGSNAYSIALLSTIFWAINPVQIQAVTYIVQRMASLAALFYIAAMFFYLQGRTSRSSFLTFIHYFLCLLSALLAFGSKENAVMLPITLLIFDACLIQGLRRDRLKHNALVLLLLMTIAILIGLLLHHAAPFSWDHLLKGYQMRGFNLSERLLTETRVIFYYMSLLLYPMPHRLSIEHDVPISRDLFHPPTTMAAVLGLVMILFLLIVKSRRWPMVSFSVLFFLLNHVIESTVLPLELVFEHRNYLPSMMFFVPVSFCILTFMEFVSEKRFLRLISGAALALILIGLGHNTFVRIHIWQAGTSLWLDAALKNPKSTRAFHNLGRYYLLSGQKKKAIAAFQTAVGLERGSYRETRQESHNSLALIYFENGEVERALRHLYQALEIDSRYQKTWLNLGALYMKTGQYDRAINCFSKALDSGKGTYKVHNNLGHMYLKKGIIAKAAAQFRKALALNPAFESSLRGLGICHKLKKEYDTARHFFETALARNPKRVLTRLHLIETLHLLKAHDRACRLAAETHRLIPRETLGKIVKQISTEEHSFEKIPHMNVVLPYLKQTDCP